jgi:hypothetical protein
LNAVTYASFPVTENGTTTELVADDANLAMEAPYGSNFDWTGFLLGFCLGILGVLLAYIIDPYMLKSALIGLASVIVLFLLLWITVFSVVVSSVPDDTWE